MRQRVKVKIRPGGTLLFPDSCVNCSSPAAERIVVRKRNGRTTRTIDLPLCTDCHHEVIRESAEEEKMRSFGRLGSVSGGLLILIILLLLLPPGFTVIWRILFGAAAGLAVGAGIYTYFERRRIKGARPEKKIIQSAAVMTDFSWRAATFEFDNDLFAHRFEELNQSNLMDG